MLNIIFTFAFYLEKSFMKKIIIIGGGISGLSAGIYARLNGFKTEIYEMNPLPGGECTGWDRKDYHFDGCIHYLYGSKKGTSLYNIWKEVGGLSDTTEIVNTDIFYQFEEHGQCVNIYKDVEKLQQHLLEISPEDNKQINELCKALRVFHKLELFVNKPMDYFTPIDFIKMMAKILPLAKYLKKFGSITMAEFAMQFKNPLLQKAFQFEIPVKNSAIAFLNILSSMSVGDCGWPMGGSRQFAKRMEEKYRALGGEIFYKSPVEKIIVENGKAIGVMLAKGNSHFADYIISSADGFFTLHHLLEGKFNDKKFNTLFSEHESYPTYVSLQVSLGINSDLSHIPEMIYFKTENKIHTGGFVHEYIGLKHFAYDASMAPKGKSVVTVLLEADFDWWNEKYKDKEIYKEEKNRVASEVIAAIETRFPEIKGRIEIFDVATPMTYVRYNNAWRGAWMSWMTTPKQKIRFHSGELKGLKNMYLTGQWTMPPGGLPVAVVSGKWTIQRIAKDCKIKFTATKK